MLSLVSVRVFQGGPSTSPGFYPQIVAMRSNFKEARYDLATVAYLPLYSPGPVQTWSCLNLPMNPLVASMMRLSNAEDAKSQIGRICRKRKASTPLPRTWTQPVNEFAFARLRPIPPTSSSPTHPAQPSLSDHVLLSTRRRLR